MDGEQVPFGMHDNLIRHMRKLVQVPEADVPELATYFQPLHLRRKDMLYHQGGQSDLECYVVHGCLRAYYTDELGNEHLLRFAIEDWWVNDVASFNRGAPALHSVQALDDTLLLGITYPRREELFARFPYVERFYRLLYESAINALHRRVVERMSTDGATRYRDFCLRYPGLDQRLPLYLIASYLDITPQYLSQLRRAGIRRSSETS